MSDPVKMRVYSNGTPPHVQVFVGPDQACVDYIDADGEIVYTVVHDRVSIEPRAEADNLEIEEVDMGFPSPPNFAKAAIERTNAESTGKDIPPDPNDKPEPEPDEPKPDSDDVLTTENLLDRNVDTILEIVGDNAEMAAELREAEVAGSERKTLIMGLDQIIANAEANTDEAKDEAKDEDEKE